MFQEKTVIVVGAAASMDLGFPLGTQLKEQIADILEVQLNEWGNPQWNDRNRVIYWHAKEDKHRLIEAGRIISEGIGLSSSVDNFLEMRRTNESITFLAKAAIAHLILEKERLCGLLRPDLQRHSLSRPSFDGKWHQKFAEICFEGCNEDDIPDALSRVQFISFNYDRCVEQFVRFAITKLYSLPFAHSCQLADESLTVLHPYGSLGDLLAEGRSSTGMAFGYDRDSIDPFDLSQNIMTFTEQKIKEDTLDCIKAAVSDASTLVFLGFGFHRQNIELLSANRDRGDAIRVIGTAKGLSARAKEVTKGRLMNQLISVGGTSGDFTDQLDAITLYDYDCATLLDEHRLDLIE